MSTVRDAEWNRRVRGETDAERIDRNFSDLLQELRVLKTGTQILFAFLLTVPFSNGFSKVTPTQRAVYFATFVTSALAAAMLIAPAAMHRLLFRQHMKADLVAMTSAMAVGGQALLTLAVAGSVWLIGDYLYGTAAAYGMAALALVWWTAWSFVVPLGMRLRHERAEAADEPRRDAHS
jgi:hypothetical protein